MINELRKINHLQQSIGIKKRDLPVQEFDWYSEIVDLET